MMKAKQYSIYLTNDDILDIKLLIEKNNVVGFVINYRARIDDVWYQIYRVDTAHGYLHEQRFWISPEPIPLPKQLELKYIFNFYLDEIKKNFARYKRYYIERMKK